MQRVIVLADRLVHAQALAAALGAYDGFMVDAAATDVAGVHSGSVPPDVVVLDAATPQEVAASMGAVQRRWPDATAVVLDGIADLDALVSAVQAASGELTMLSSAAVARARDRLRSSVPRSPVAGYGQLTPREREVLELLSKGVAPVAIAERLGISVNTCRGYLRTLMAKMGARSQREVVAFVGLHGLPD
jgi:DNA-binding NarL/FixJ family response regulator